MNHKPMGRIKKIQYDCRHATYLIEKREHKPLTLKENIQLLIHLAGCSVCRLFRRQNRQITQLMRNIFQRSAARPHLLDEKFKQEMQEKINQRLPN
ncbi:hypothetical protein [Puia sp.]|jgi:hypothetical protein|uniref:hypothetical protein n=1 Tax=Puia sp. TaxID=2045100 RepID=UPI002F427A3E